MECVERPKEQSVIQRINSNGIQSPCDVTDIGSDNAIDDAAVKPLKILAQICVDELKKCNEIEMLSKGESSIAENLESIYISSDSESDISSSSQIGAIIGGGAKRKSCSDFDTYSESDSSSDSSSSDSNDSDDACEEDVPSIQELSKNDNVENKTSDDKNEPSDDKNETSYDKNEPSNEIRPTESNLCEKSLSISIDVTNELNDVNPTENVVAKVFNPVQLKDLCNDVLHAHSMIRYDVPTLKDWCEHTMAKWKIPVPIEMEVPLLCLVQGEGQLVCLDSEFDETELANLFNGSGNGVCESVEICQIENESVDTDKTSLIDQCVALEHILSSPPPDNNHTTIANEATIDDDATYMMVDNVYEMNDGFHDSIQYEETVLPSESCSMGKIKSLKKHLQKKYVQTSNYHKMFVINKLLRKYKVHQVSSFDKKSIVQQRLQKVILKIRQKSKQHGKPKKQATRRSARIADKIKQQQNDELDSHLPVDKHTKSTKHTKTDDSKSESKENLNRHSCKIINVNELIQNSGNKKSLTDTDKESITRDILKLIAKKRTLKRKLSICHRPNFSFDDDGYCYDEDGQISEMVSSFINNSFDEASLGSSVAKKPRSRKPSLENRPSKEASTKKKKTTSTVPKKQPKLHVENKGKLKKSNATEKSTKKGISKTKSTSELSLNESSTGNKTEKKNTFLGANATFTPKVSVKEVIPAKRTRFLSIDGSLLKYGTDAKKSYNPMKSFKDKLDLQETTKRKIPSQKNDKKTIDASAIKENSVKKDVSKVTKSIKENHDAGADCSSTCIPAASKPLNKSIVPPSATRQPNKPQSILELMKIPLKKSSIKENNDSKETQISKQAKVPGSSMKKDECISEKLPKASSDEDGKIQKLNQTSDRNHVERVGNHLSHSTNHSIQIEKNSHGPKIRSIEKPEEKPSSKGTPKPLHKKHEKLLPEQSFSSTMVSPLKIIIEPRRPTATIIDRTTPKDPLAIDDDLVSSKVVSSTQSSSMGAKQSIEEKKVQRPTRFSDRLINTSEASSITNSFSLNNKTNEDPRLRSSMERVRAAALTSSQTMSTMTDPSVMVGSYLDIEKYLPSTKIMQPKPARRCLSRAQTISSAESPMIDSTFEPMQLRSSANAWNSRKSGSSNEFSSHQFSRSSFQPAESLFSTARRNQTQNVNSSMRNSSAFKAQDSWSNLNQNVPIHNIRMKNVSNHSQLPSSVQNTQRTSMQNAHFHNTPTYKAVNPSRSTQNSPSQNTWVQRSPIQNSPIRNSPVQSSPIQSSPIQGSPIRNSPSQSSHSSNLLLQKTMMHNKSILKVPFENRSIPRGAIQRPSNQNVPAQSKLIRKSPIKKTPIDMTSYPDPESLQIPLIDLRSPTSSLSPLLIPTGSPSVENMERAPSKYFIFYDISFRNWTSLSIKHDIRFDYFLFYSSYNELRSS